MAEKNTGEEFAEKEKMIRLALEALLSDYEPCLLSEATDWLQTIRIQNAIEDHLGEPLPKGLVAREMHGRNFLFASQPGHSLAWAVKRRY